MYMSLTPQRYHLHFNAGRNAERKASRRLASFRRLVETGSDLPHRRYAERKLAHVVSVAVVGRLPVFEREENPRS